MFFLKPTKLGVFNFLHSFFLMCLNFLQRAALFASTSLDSIFNITRFQVFSNFHIISMLIHKLLNSTILKFLVYGGVFICCF